VLLEVPAPPRMNEVYAITNEQFGWCYRDWTAPGSFVTVNTDQPTLLDHDPDLIACLQYEAQRRGITLQEAYREEMDGQERARRGAFTPEEFQRLIETSQPDPRLLEGDEECPFWP